MLNNSSKVDDRWNFFPFEKFKLLDIDKSAAFDNVVRMAQQDVYDIKLRLWGRKKTFLSSYDKLCWQVKQHFKATVAIQTTFTHDHL